MKRFFKTYGSKNQTIWPEYIDVIGEFSNDMIKNTTGFTPNELHLNKQNLRFWHEILKIPQETKMEWTAKIELTKKRIQRKQEERSKKHILKHKLTEFNIGDKILLETASLAQLASGETEGLLKFMKDHTELTENT